MNILRTVIYRLWLIGSGLWVCFWLAIFWLDGRYDTLMLQFAVWPPLGAGLLLRLLLWAFTPLQTMGKNDD